jgi:hypothetical protein
MHMFHCVVVLQGFKPKRSLEVMMFTSEEPTRFKLSCVGSRAMAGALTADTLDVKLDENGTSFLEVGLRMNVLVVRSERV